MRSLLIPSIALVLLGSTPAVAQRVVPRAPVIGSFGECAVRQSPGVARSLMQTELGSREEYQRARQLFMANGACIRGRAVLSSQVGEIRGTAAEALLRADQAALARLADSPARPAVRVPVAEGRAFVAAYAACLADADPAKSVALLATERQSRAELDAVMAFGDTLNDCMPMEASYRIDRFDVRNHIAARLYQIAYANQPEPSDA